MKKILIVDDSEAMRKMLALNVTKLGLEVFSAANGEIAISKAIQVVPDMILMGIEMPVMNGYEATKEIRTYEALKKIPLIMVTSLATKESIIKAIRSGANDYVVKPFKMGMLLGKLSNWLNVDMEEHWKALPADQEKVLHLLKVGMEGIFEAVKKDEAISFGELANACELLAASIEEHGFTGILRILSDYNNTLFLHSLLVCIHLFLFSGAKELGRQERVLMAAGGLLHDIGSAKIPHDLLFKPGTLEPDEFEAIKAHVGHGVECLKKTRDIPATIVDLCWSHHERIDGTGYPRGLKDKEISLPARMLAIVEAYTALTTKSVYRKTRTPHEALEQLRSPEGHLDQDLLTEFEHAVLSGFKGKETHENAKEGEAPSLKANLSQPEQPQSSSPDSSAS